MADQNQHINLTTQSDPEHLTGLVNTFISMMNQGNIEKLDLEYGGLKLSLRAHRSATVAPGTGSPTADLDGAEPETLADQASDTYTVTAPMIGTFYAAPAPNEPPYVAPGDTVERGQTIGIIEAMKIMNEIAADRDGAIVEIVADNGQTVEYGSPLVVIRPTAS